MSQEQLENSEKPHGSLISVSEQYYDFNSERTNAMYNFAYTLIVDGVQAFIFMSLFTFIL